jgi:tetratricopeptide (TPR) repeat protein
MQSGQYDKAVERFKNLMDINPANIQALYYLGVSLYETSQLVEADAVFEKVKNTSNDPAIISSTEAYLKKLKEL